MRYRLLGVVLLILAIIPLTSVVVSYQGACGIANWIQHPIDTTQYVLTQDFAVPSPRHQGRYHMGEDWYAGRNQTLGQPVTAAARGRVTYSWQFGWGRDGGVIVLEHTFPDGSVIYTQYGHLTESETNPFPAQWDCVEMGDVIGVIADVRPAPHIHFEIRQGTPQYPSSGYSWESPTQMGWLNPTEYIIQKQAALSQ